MRSLRFIALLGVSAQVAIGQQAVQPPPPAVHGTTLTTTTTTTLTLEDAIATAQRNNPQYIQVKNNLRTADAQIRAAYGALLPSASGSFSTSWQQGGTQYVQGIALPSSSDAYYGRYYAGVNYSINAGLAFAPRAAKATRRASEADITNQSEVLRAAVTTQYITALQADATAALQDSLVQTAQGQLELANAKMQVGAGTVLEVRTAQVAVGQAEVNALRDHNTARVERLRLFQQMGVPADIDVQLTTTFPVAQPTFTLDSLLVLARRVNPDLAARKSREQAAEMGVKLAQTAYLPALTLSTGYGANSFGYTNADILVAQATTQAAAAARSCRTQDSIRVGAGLAPKGCDSGVIPPDQLDAIRASNKPFSFQKAPYSVSAFVSIPIFNNFQRERDLETQRVQRDNALNDVRGRALQLTTDVTQAYLNLVTAARTVELQTQVAARATEELAFAEESYKVGARTFLDVTTARGTYEQAVIGRVNAIYDYHKAFAALESAVGRPLR
jgi:outer membrane protein